MPTSTSSSRLKKAASGGGLSIEDQCSLRLAIAECARTQAVAEAATWAQKAHEFASQLDAIQRAEARAAAAEEAKLRKNQAEATHHHAQEEQRLLAKQIAERYDVDWQKTAFDPVSGLLLPIPQE